MNKVNILLRLLAYIILFLTGCVPKNSTCPIQSLILDEKLLPTGTHEEPIESPLLEFPKESAAQTFYYAPDSIFQEVVKWNSAHSAKKEFQYYRSGAFDEDKYRGPWSTPSDLYSSSIADNYYAACGVAGTIYQCRMTATYDKYSVFFRAEISPEGITMAKVNELLQSIDQQMANCTDQ